MQMPSVFGGVEARDQAHAVGQEDCLYLNVFAPRFRTRGGAARRTRDSP